MSGREIVEAWIAEDFAQTRERDALAARIDAALREARAEALEEAAHAYANATWDAGVLGTIESVIVDLRARAEESRRG